MIKNSEEKSKAEFDDFIEDYRKEQSQHLSIAGEDSEFFAKYKTHHLATSYPEMLGKNINILDFGCGDGLMTFYISKYFNNAKIFGTDISLESLKVAQMQCSSATFEHMEKNIIPFSDQTFDIVVSAGVFHHIPFEEHAHFIEEINRVLKPGGVAVYFELNPLNLGTCWIFYNHPMEVNAKMLQPLRWFDLLADKGTWKIDFLAFFPGWLADLRFLEPYLTKIPFGALYAVHLKKNLLD